MFSDGLKNSHVALGSLCRHRRTSHFHSNSRKQFLICVSFAITINKAHGQTILHVEIYLPELYSPMASYMLHCQGVCQERRNGFWPSRTRRLINLRKAPKILSIEMFMSGEKGSYYGLLFASMLL
jgi:hypothetical protein